MLTNIIAIKEYGFGMIVFDAKDNTTILINRSPKKT